MQHVVLHVLTAHCCRRCLALERLVLGLATDCRTQRKCHGTKPDYDHFVKLKSPFWPKGTSDWFECL